MKKILITLILAILTFITNAQTIEEVISSGTSGDATLKIEADTDNNNENDNPLIKFAQDGGLTNGYFGLIGNSNEFFNNSTVNGLFVKASGGFDFQIATNNEARLTVTKDGNVGIGTNTPANKLDVIGDVSLSGDLKMSGTDGYIWTNGTGTGYTGIWDAKNARSLLYASENTGNIGVGITNPSSKLQVEGRTSVGKSGVLNLDWTHETNWGGSSSKWAGYVGFNAYRNNDDAKDNYYGKNTYTNKGVFEGSNFGFRWLYRKHISYDSQGQHQLSEYMRLDNNGNLGIGTTAPDAKLTVKGNIHSQEVKVDLLGAVAPDYVFYLNYNLKTLTEVESFINTKGHLPNIPSAKEMETEGIKLKEMNLKLLEKIEELTLYTIDQEKRIKALEKENASLKTQEERVKLLEKHVALLLKMTK